VVQIGKGGKEARRRGGRTERVVYPSPWWGGGENRWREERELLGSLKRPEGFPQLGTCTYCLAAIIKSTTRYPSIYNKRKN